MANAILKNLAETRQSKITHHFTFNADQCEIFWRLQFVSSAMYDQLYELSKRFPQSVDLQAADKWLELSNALSHCIQGIEMYEERVIAED